MDEYLQFNTNDDAFSSAAKEQTKIHIRVQQMGKKWITTIDGMDNDLDLARIAKAMKKTLHCAANVTVNKEQEEVIQLQGDQREYIRSWLVANEVLTEAESKERIVVHGG